MLLLLARPKSSNISFNQRPKRAAVTRRKSTCFASISGLVCLRFLSIHINGVLVELIECSGSMCVSSELAGVHLFKGHERRVAYNQELASVSNLNRKQTTLKMLYFARKNATYVARTNRYQSTSRRTQYDTRVAITMCQRYERGGRGGTIVVWLLVYL